MSRIFQKSPFNYEYKMGLYNAVDYNITQTLATGIVTNQVLGSVLLLSGAYVRDGQELHLRAAGRTGGTGSKSLRLRMNTLSLIAVSAITPANNTAWQFEAVIRRTGSGTVYKTAKFFYNMGESAGSAAPSILGTSGSLTTGFDIGAVDLSFDVQVDVAVAAETVRHDDMSIAIL